MISRHGFHQSSVEVFQCKHEHNMDGEHFNEWIKQTCAKLRKEYGKMKKYSELSLVKYVLFLRKDRENMHCD